MRYGPILYREWEKTEDGRIKGYWAEDDSVYYITAPEQLIDFIVGLQNSLSRKLQMFLKKDKELRELFDFLNDI